MTPAIFTRRLFAAALACTLGACDGGDPGKTGPAVPPPAPTIAKRPDAPAPTVQPDPPPAPRPLSKPQLAAAIAREISVAPELADEILTRHGLDRPQFDALMFEIAADPALTSDYMAARRGK